MLPLNLSSLTQIIALAQTIDGWIRAVRSGKQKVVNTDGTEMTQAQLDAVFTSIYAAQDKASADIAARIENANKG